MSVDRSRKDRDPTDRVTAPPCPKEFNSRFQIRPHDERCRCGPYRDIQASAAASSQATATCRRKKHGGSMAANLKTRALRDQDGLPLVVEPDGDRDLSSYRDEILDLVRSRLSVTGGLLFRGFDVGGVDRFESFARWFADELLRYDYGSTPRSSISGRVYTSTEYPASQPIPLHNEMSYTREWPMKIWFYSIQVAPRGGETPIGDS